MPLSDKSDLAHRPPAAYLRPARLGRRVLRTGAVSLVGLILYEWGDLGGAISA